MKHLAWTLCVLLVAATASAEESSIPLVLEVRAQRISQGQLEEALRKELARTPAGDAPQGQLSLQDEASNVVRLTYRDALGHESTRELYLAPDDPEALEKITIAAANLVRDQAAALLAQLEAERAARAEVAPAPPPPAPVAAAPKPVAPKPAPHIGYDPCRPAATIGFGADLAPGVGTSSMAQGRDSARRVSLGFLGTLSAGVRGFELSLGININRRGACGAQIAVGVNAAMGPVHAFQLSLVNLANDWLEGAQLGLINFARGDAHGAQLGLANASGGQVRGIQLGLANFARRGAHGAELGIANVAFDAVPFQLGVLNVARHESRAQLGVTNVVAGSARAQLGVGNLAWGDARLQLGALNVARDETRAQLGAVNIARRSRAPVGLLSVIWDGHTTLDAWASENGTLLAGVTHGGDRVRNTFAAGTRAGSQPRTVFALGIGSRLWTDRRFNLELDALYEMLPHFSPFRYEMQTARLKLDATIWLHERVGLLVGAGYALMMSTNANDSSQAWFGETAYRHARPQSDARTGLYGFPTINLGVRIALSNPDKPGF